MKSMGDKYTHTGEILMQIDHLNSGISDVSLLELGYGTVIAEERVDSVNENGGYGGHGGNE
jgi:hypothetical protein